MNASDSTLEDDTDLLQQYDDDECVLCAENPLKYLEEPSNLKTASCGHRFCLSCTQSQFSHARSFSCPVPSCKNQVRKVNLRTETKTMLDYQREISIRKAIMKEFGRERKVFADTPEYNDYLEEVEELIVNRVKNKNTAHANQRIATNRRQNKAAIAAYQARCAARDLRTEALIRTYSLYRGETETKAVPLGTKAVPRGRRVALGVSVDQKGRTFRPHPTGIVARLTSALRRRANAPPPIPRNADYAKHTYRGTQFSNPTSVANKPTNTTKKGRELMIEQRAGGAVFGKGKTSPPYQSLSEVLRNFPILSALGVSNANENELAALGIKGSKRKGI